MPSFKEKTRIEEDKKIYPPFLVEEFRKFILFPLIAIIPEVGLSIKDSIFNNVDFPEPDGPTIEYIFPKLNLKLIFLRTLIFLLVMKDLDILLRVIKLFIF